MPAIVEYIQELVRKGYAYHAVTGITDTGLQNVIFIVKEINMVPHLVHFLLNPGACEIIALP